MAAMHPDEELKALHWRAWHRGTLASGGLWGAADWLFYGHGEPLQRLAMVLVI
jgi:hypothetical protein